MSLSRLVLARRVASVALLAAAGAVLAACGSSPSASSSSSASSLASKALADAAAGGWVHEATTATEPGHTYVSSNDIGTAAGRQMIKVDAATATVLIVDHTAYIRGNESAIVHFFGLRTTTPKRYAGKWIRIGATDAGYSTVSSAVTLASDFGQVKILGPLTAGSPVTIAGQRVIPIHGHVKGSSTTTVPATLYVTASGTVLPVRFRVSNGSVTVTTTWTRWGTHVVLVAPTSTIPISSISG